MLQQLYFDEEQKRIFICKPVLKDETSYINEFEDVTEQIVELIKPLTD